MNELSSSKVFGRSGADKLSANAFYALIGVFVVYGLGGTALVAHQVSLVNYIPGKLEVLFFGLAIPIAGIILALRSDKPFYSFVGYNMVLIPFGVILAPILNYYEPDVIEKAFTMTCGTTLFMTLASFMFPKFFSKLGNALFISLIGLLIVRIVQGFLPSLSGVTWIDYVAAGIFSLYIGYDLWRAQETQKTVDNAIDIALALYLDIINLFLTLLKIFGKK